LGLHVLAQFVDHEGFDGVMLGEIGSDVHFEFTHERGAAAIELVPSPEDLIVLYLEEDDWTKRTCVIEATCRSIVRSHNPYWDQHGITIEDPDGYRVVLHRGPWGPSDSRARA